jgi:ABC-type nitrate/sulfonate/bicarbonate transport system substrate-binding protein
VSAPTLGFIPLTDCAPLVVAAAKGLFAAEGLEVTLSREASWATIRDKVAVGALDAAHMLAPMALAATAGLATPDAPMIAPLALAVNGAGITLSNALIRALGPEATTPQTTAAALARVIGERRAGGEPPLTFAVVFPFSIHNYALRYWLAQAGIDPDQDVRLVVVPPPRMVEQLLTGQVDGISVGAPWNAVAARGGLGRIVLRSSQFWPAGPDKVLGVAEAFAAQDPARLQAVLRALVRAQVWADDPEHRDELTALLARPEYVGAEPEAIAAALADELVFHRDAAALPRLEHARWLLAQMRRWNQIGDEVDHAALAARVYRPDLALEALRAVGPEPVPAQAVARLFDGRAFDAGLVGSAG